MTNLFSDEQLGGTDAKQCRSCRETKPLRDFYRRLGDWTASCKACISARDRAKRVPKPPKTHCKRGHPLSGPNLRVRPDGNRTCRICHAKSPSRNSDKYKAKARERAQSPKCKAKDREYYRRNAARIRDVERKRRYGVTAEQWDRVFEAQGRVCGCCGTDRPSKGGGKLTWHTDHDHKTRRVRGILCISCNVILGKLGDTSGEVAKACTRFLSYLEHTARRTDELLAEVA